MELKHHINRTIFLSLPLVGSQLAQMAINATDTIMLGWDGTLSLASGVLGTQAIFLFYILGAGFGHAVVPLAASAHAQEDKKAVRRSVRMGLWITGLLMMISMPILWLVEDVYLWLGQDPQVSSLARDYVRVAQWSLFPAMFALVFRNFFATIDKAQIVFWAIIPGIFINIALNYVLIFGNFGAPALGVVGAAWASVITNILIFLILILWVFMHSQYREFELLTRFWRSDWVVFGKVLRLGVPISVSILAEVSMFAGAAILMGWIGAKELAAHGIAVQLGGIAFMIPLGIAGAATIRVGNAYGRQNLTDISLASKAALFVALVFALVTAAILAIFPGELVSFFLDENSIDAVELLAIAIPLVLVAAAFQIVDSAQVIAAGALRGFQDVTVPMVISIICYGPLGLAIGYVFAFVFEMGPVGIWLGLMAGLGMTSLFLGLRYAQMISRIRHSFTQAA